MVPTDDWRLEVTLVVFFAIEGVFRPFRILLMTLFLKFVVAHQASADGRIAFNSVLSSIISSSPFYFVSLEYVFCIFRCKRGTLGSSRSYIRSGKPWNTMSIRRLCQIIICEALFALSPLIPLGKKSLRTSTLGVVILYFCRQHFELFCHYSLLASSLMHGIWLRCWYKALRSSAKTLGGTNPAGTCAATWQTLRNAPTILSALCRRTSSTFCRISGT